MENITINNLTMMDVPDYAIYITTGKRNRTPGVTTNSRDEKYFDLQRHRRRRGK
jgi:hypothetical protein